MGGVGEVHRLTLRLDGVHVDAAGMWKARFRALFWTAGPAGLPDVQREQRQPHDTREMTLRS